MGRLYAFHGILNSTLGVDLVEIKPQRATLYVVIHNKLIKIFKYKLYGKRKQKRINLAKLLIILHDNN